MKNRHLEARRRRHAFTLVEIMVALGMLMLMMTFLFEFVLSGQKLWRASDRRTRLNDRAQVVLDVISQDLKNIQSGATTDDEAPVLFAKNQPVNFVFPNNSNPVQLSNCDVYVLIVRGELASTDTYYVGVYPLMIVFDRRNHRVYRRRLEPQTAGNDDPWLYYGVSATAQRENSAFSGNAITVGNSLIASFLDGYQIHVTDDLLMDNVLEFSIFAEGDTTSLQSAFNVPGNLDLRVTMLERDAIDPDEWETIRNDTDELDKYSYQYFRHIEVFTPDGVPMD